jgi:hypothetical protein
MFLKIFIRKKRRRKKKWMLNHLFESSNQREKSKGDFNMFLGDSILNEVIIKIREKGYTQDFLGNEQKILEMSLSKKRAFEKDEELLNQTIEFSKLIEALSLESKDVIFNVIADCYLQKIDYNKVDLYEKDLLEFENEFIEDMKSVIYECIELIETLGIFDKVKIDNVELSEEEKANSKSLLNEDNKNVLITSYAIKIVIPILTEFSKRFNANINRLVATFSIISLNYLKEKNGSDSLTKIVNLINSRIDSVFYANRKIWNYLYNEGHTTTSFFSTQLRQVLSAIPKIKAPLNMESYSLVNENFSSVSFIHTFVVKQQEFLFRRKLQHNYRIHQGTSGGDDHSNIFDSCFSLPSANIGQKQLVLYTFEKKKEDLFHLVRKDLPVNYKDEIQSYLKALSIHLHIVSILKIFSIEFLNSYEYLKKIDIVTFAYFLSHYLRTQSFVVIPEILLSNITIPRKKFEFKDLDVFSEDERKDLHLEFSPKIKASSLILSSNFNNPFTSEQIEITKRQLSGELVRFVRNSMRR